MDFGKWILCDQPFGKFIFLFFFLGLSLLLFVVRKVLSRTNYFKKPDADSTLVPMSKDEFENFRRLQLPYQLSSMAAFVVVLTFVFWGFAQLWFHLRFSDKLTIAIPDLVFIIPAMAVGVCLSSFFVRRVLRRKFSSEFLRFQSYENEVTRSNQERFTYLFGVFVTFVALLFVGYTLWATSVLEGNTLSVRRFGTFKEELKSASQVSKIKRCLPKDQSAPERTRYVVFFSDGFYWRIDGNTAEHELVEQLSKVSGVLVVDAPLSECGLMICDHPHDPSAH